MLNAISSNHIINHKISNNKKAIVFSGNRFNELQNDEFVYGNDAHKDKDCSKSKKIKIAAGIGIAATIAFLVAKGRFSEAKNLAEHIEFKPAKTIEEARKFGKTHLGIKHYIGFEDANLDAINWANEGFVNVSNRLKGKLRMPKVVSFQNFDDNTMAGVVVEKGNKYEGYFVINKQFFENPEKFLEDAIARAKKNAYINEVDGKLVVNDFFEENTRKELVNAIEDFQNNKNFNSAVRAKNALTEMENAVNSYNNNPLRVIDLLLKSDANKHALKNNNLMVDMNKIKDLPFEEQCELRDKMIGTIHVLAKFDFINETIAKNKEVANKLVEKGLIKNTEFIKSLERDQINTIFNEIETELGEKRDFFPIVITADIKNVSPFRTIYHEMGHIQDMIPRADACNKYEYKYDKYPEALKKWVDDKSTIRAAHRISAYAADGPGEFIAETFAKLISGQKIPKESYNLYVKLNGPKIPNMDTQIAT